MKIYLMHSADESVFSVEGPHLVKDGKISFLLISTSKLEKLPLTRLTHRLSAQRVQSLSEFVWNLQDGAKELD